MCFLNIHTHKAQNNQEWQNLYPDEAPIEGAFSVGIHPWYINSQWKQDFLKVKHKASLPNCKAIGECGLDKLANSSMDLQEEVFMAHITLAEHLKKPLIIHCVKAYSQVMALRKKTKAKQMWILHGFHKTEQLAWDLLKNGIKLSFGQALLHDVRLQELVKKLSPSDYFLETDTSPIPIEVIYRKVETLTHS